MTDAGALIAYLEDGDSARAAISSIVDNLAFYQNLDASERVDAFAGSIYNWFIRECVGRNQYLVFQESSYKRIFALYRDLIIRLRGLSRGSERVDAERAVAKIVLAHRANLVAVIKEIAREDQNDRAVFPCAEYSAEFQLSVLALGDEPIPGPFLDVGCGEKASLVRAVRARGIEAVGIDQYMDPGADSVAIRANWLEFSFIPDYWGTVVSHMAFSNHFVRAARGDPELAALYHAVYRDILDSLRPGGTFRYAPALPRAEAFIDRSRFSVERRANKEGDSALDTVIVTRLR
jgi:hypothetical protein